ncbi:MAG TPA: hypothetical protein PLM10_02065 [Saccharofermentans sp.]|nr:hypothetical protein [Saccharofermentans sp.]
MDPAIAQALATLIGALTTAILMASAYYWGPRQRDIRSDARLLKQQEEALDSDEVEPTRPDDKKRKKKTKEALDE